MLIAGVAVVCVVLFVLGLLLPRLSRKPQEAVDHSLGLGARGAQTLPGRLGTWLAKPFATSRRAADKSAAASRRARSKIAD